MGGNRLRAPILVLLILAMALPAGADRCVPSSTAAEVATGPTAAGEYYVDSDMCQPCGQWHIWVYQESNGIGGLQRGDEFRDDTCGGIIAPDTIIF